MSSSIYQGLQPHVSRLKLSPSSSNSENGGLSFFQTLSKPSEKEVYIHPLVKQSSATLSDKSLQMCTESLGSETGSEIAGDDEMSLFPSDEKPHRNLSKLRELRASKKLEKARRSFPPPLSSMSGPIGFRLKPQREGGRLILEATASPAVEPCFQAERGGGRLRLRLFQHGFSYNMAKEMGKEENSEEGEGNEDEHGENVGKMRKCLETSREKLFQETERMWYVHCKDVSQRRKGLLNWETFWVST